jgi:hypothetical protein
MHLNINRTFFLTTDDRNDLMYDVSLNVVFMQIRSYDTKTQVFYGSFRLRGLGESCKISNIIYVFFINNW